MIWKSVSVGVEVTTTASSPCVGLQIMKPQEARLTTGNELPTVLQCTTCGTCQPCIIGRIASLLGVNAYTADCMSARYGQVGHGLLASL